MHELSIQYFCKYPNVKNFYEENSLFQHSEGIKALKVFSEGADGYREPLWQINDMTMEANKEWWKGQVKINDHQVGNKRS